MENTESKVVSSGVKWGKNVAGFFTYVVRRVSTLFR